MSAALADTTDTLAVAKRQLQSHAAAAGPAASLLPAQQSIQTASTAPRQGRQRTAWLVGAGLAQLLLAQGALAAEALPAGAAEAFKSLLEEVEALGSLGPLLFVATVAGCELIPLFPTQPLSLAAGLLFGPAEGAALILVSVTLAAVIAFTLSRGVGRRLAERVIAMEGKEAGQPGAAALGNGMGGILAAIEAGGFYQQAAAVAMLRLTPIVPFSASNYVLGMTPLEMPAFLTGTVTGMAVWSAVYASLGGASRSLLKSGTSLDELLSGHLPFLTDLGAKAGSYTEAAAVAGVLLLAAGGVWWSVKRPPASAGLPMPPVEEPDSSLQGLAPVKRVTRLLGRFRSNA